MALIAAGVPPAVSASDEVARGLARGYRAAFKTTMGLLLMAGFASLLKGLDYEEALILSVILGIVAP